MILTFFTRFRKYIIIAAILIGLFFAGRYAYNRITYLEKENQRQATNIINKDFAIKIEKTKSGEAMYAVQALTVKADEMKYFSQNVVDKLNDMGLKIKNLQSATNVSYHYDGTIDTVKTKMVAENKFLASWTDNKNLDFSGFINIPKGYPNFKLPDDFAKIDSTSNAQYPFLTNVKVTFNDSLLIVPEYTYKRRWIFWRKLTGVQLHIKSENPNFVLDRIQTFQITK